MACNKGFCKRIHRRQALWIACGDGNVTITTNPRGEIMLQFPDNPLLKNAAQTAGTPVSRKVEPEVLAKEYEKLLRQIASMAEEIGELKATIVRQQERLYAMEFQLRNLAR